MMSVFNTGTFASQLLLRNEPQVYDQKALTLIKDKNILVTGAGGSIGGEIVRQLQYLDPSVRITFIDNDEYALYCLQLSLTGRSLLDSIHYRLADIADRVAMNNIFREVQPDIVFHAAAHKHLPLLERAPGAAIKTNLQGTEVIAEMCALHNVGYLINISTDKAANPTSILGMTKRLAEIRAATHANARTKVMSVRFGNVLGSRGSFLETLSYQIANAKSVTITDTRMTRYFMTIPEAAGLVIEAAILGESGKIYVLDMGQPVRILDIIQRYVQIMNCEVPNLIETGARPGEKIHEDLFGNFETHQTTAHPRIQSVNVSADSISHQALTNLYRMVKLGRSAAELHAVLIDLVSSEATDKPKELVHA